MHAIRHSVLARLLSLVSSYGILGSLARHLEVIFNLNWYSSGDECMDYECVDYTDDYMTITSQTTYALINATLKCYPRPSPSIQLNNEHPSILRIPGMFQSLSMGSIQVSL